jgi:hypothetical protein
MLGLLLLQPLAQGFPQRLGPGDAPLAAQGIELTPLRLRQIHDGTHDVVI